jgi:hypothetical protein
MRCGFLLLLTATVGLSPSAAFAVPNEVKECSLQAEKQFKSLEYVGVAGASYQSHYNKRLDKCLILADSGLPNRHMTLMDAYEGRAYAEYLGTFGKLKFQTIFCWISLSELSNGAQRRRNENQSAACETITEWYSLTDVYMRE